VSTRPRLYGELAEWFHLLTAPEDYEEKAAYYRQVMVDMADGPVRDVLELGSGGGNNASHLKAHFTMTLTDLSEEMLTVSRGLNPECEHLVGDMRDLRLGRTFDAVFVHDAVAYLTTEEDLGRAIDTAYVHCRNGAVALFCPEGVREDFSPATRHGGHDRGGRALRYLQWEWDPDPSDTTCVADLAMILRDEDGSVRLEYDRHEFGLFPTATWLRLMTRAGFEAKAIRFEHSDAESGGVVIVGVRR
jgi:SAM-dependent methyltransferase